MRGSVGLALRVAREELGSARTAASLVEERGVDKRSIELTRYWRPRMTQDDAPTEEDLAGAQERLADTTAAR